MHYELWDLDSGNLIDAHASEAEALADARSRREAGVDPVLLGLRAGIDEGEDDDVTALSPPLRGPDLVARFMDRGISPSRPVPKVRRPRLQVAENRWGRAHVSRRPSCPVSRDLTG
jgi:hypothetical protein